jgi:hypothetical protein
MTMTDIEILLDHVANSEIIETMPEPVLDACLRLMGFDMEVFDKKIAQLLENVKKGQKIR